MTWVLEHALKIVWWVGTAIVAVSWWFFGVKSSVSQAISMSKANAERIDEVERTQSTKLDRILEEVGYIRGKLEAIER